VLAKLDFDANKQLAKALGVRALPSFALFRGADGKLDLFTAGPARAALLREKVERFGAPRCVLSGEIGGGGSAASISPELRELLEKQQKEAAAAAAGESK
jgi:thioredoxin-like negative regulator of GroEL